jgi:hypothetical protein
VRQYPQCQVKVERGRKYGGSLWNRVTINYCYKVISSSGLVAAILNRQSTSSGDVDSFIFRSAVVENVGVAVGIMSVCCCKLKLHRPTENLRFFQGGCPRFSSSFQVLERAMFTGKTLKHPALDPLGIGFDRILKFARVAKIFEKT